MQIPEDPTGIPWGSPGGPPGIPQGFPRDAPDIRRGSPGVGEIPRDPWGILGGSLGDHQADSGGTTRGTLLFEIAAPDLFNFHFEMHARACKERVRVMVAQATFDKSQWLPDLALCSLAGWLRLVSSAQVISEWVRVVENY